MSSIWNVLVNREDESKSMRGRVKQRIRSGFIAASVNENREELTPEEKERGEYFLGVF